MKRLEHKIRWALVTKFLKVTKSTPQQLLDWLKWGFRYVPIQSFICNRKLYLDKHHITKATRYTIDGSYDNAFEVDSFNTVYIPELVTGLNLNSDYVPPAELWYQLNNDKKFRKEMIDKFKKHYKLK